LGIAGDGGAARIRLVLPGARNGRLNKRCGHGGDDGYRNGAEQASLVAAEKDGPPRQQNNRAGDRGRQRGNQDVLVFDVGQFVRDHALDLVAGHQMQQPRRDGDSRVVFVAAGGKSVGRVGGNNVNLRHRDLRLLRQIRHGFVKSGSVRPDDRSGVVHLQNNRVRKPVAAEIHQDRKNERDHHARSPGDQIADNDQHSGKDAQKQDDFQRVHAVVSPAKVFSSRFSVAL